MWRCALVLFGLARSVYAAEPSHLALVVINSAYQTLPALPGCQASTAVVSAALHRAGWSVTELRDPSNGQLGAGLASFADAVGATPGAGALVYACGYAAAFESRLFLLPASARLVRDTDALTEGVVLPALTGVVARANVGAGLIVVDLAALPGKPAIAPEAATRRAPGSHVGLLVAAIPAGAPDGPSETAAALVRGLAEHDLSVGKAQSLIGDALTAAGIPDFAQPPAEDGWLAGGPPPVIAAAPPEPQAPEPPAAPPTPSAPPEPPTDALPAPPQALPQPVVVGNPAAFAALGDLDRRRVQLALQRLGYYAGRVDGTLGAESLAAIRRYQHELGAEMNGRLTEEQAVRLLAMP